MWKEKELIETLENNGIDTVCFMGSSYDFEDIKVGSIFYFSYAFMNRRGKDHNTIDNCYNWFKIYDEKRFKDHKITDSYKVITKFKRVESAYKKYQNYEHCTIKNLRTKQIITLDSEMIDNMYLLFFDTID